MVFKPEFAHDVKKQLHAKVVCECKYKDETLYYNKTEISDTKMYFKHQFRYMLSCTKEAKPF